MGLLKLLGIVSRNVTRDKVSPSNVDRRGFLRFVGGSTTVAVVGSSVGCDMFDPQYGSGGFRCDDSPDCPDDQECHPSGEYWDSGAP